MLAWVVFLNDGEAIVDQSRCQQGSRAMEHKPAKAKTTHRRKPASAAARAKRHYRALVMSQREFASLGGGEVAYIRPMTTDEAMRLYPAVKGLPSGIAVFALHAADGTPLALTDSHQAAIGHAKSDKLQVASLH